MKKKYFLLIIIGITFLLFNNYRILALNKESFVFPSDVSLLNITVNRGEEFIVVLDGRGWYANRYSRNKISIMLRIVDENKTKFDIKANNTGEAYVFFSLVGQDKYLHILIKENEKMISPETGKTKSNEVKISLVKEKVKANIKSSIENINNVKGRKSNTNVPVSSKNKVVSKINKKNEQSLKENEKGTKVQKEEKLIKREKEPPIYFIDNKSKKKIEIPIKDENKDYFNGIDRLKNGDYKGAIKLLNGYLNKCEKCSYHEDALFYIAKAYTLDGDNNNALRVYKKIVIYEKGKYYIDSLKWMANYFYNKKDLKNALNYYQKLFDKTKNIEIMRKIADISFDTGNISKSVKSYNYCVNNGLVDDKILYRLASVYDKPGKYRNIEKAYKFYRKIVENYPESKYFDISKRRVSFFEKNFINFR